ncbi:MAG: cytochrome c3 family protein [Planctomycetota bacterium]|jgi:predicted CXXCH cytochrome family protein
MRVLKFAACLAVVLMLSERASAVDGPHAFGSADLVLDSGTITARADTQICIVCHTPHNAISSTPPLWNHAAGTDTIGDTATYDSGTLDAIDVDATLGVESIACLACHDATVAVDAYGGSAGTVTMNAGGPTPDAVFIPDDLSDDHPVGFTYGTALDSELQDPTTAPSGLPAGGTIAEDMLFDDDGDSVRDQMECSTCHNVHSNANTNYLIKSNANSALCTTCHIK